MINKYKESIEYLKLVDINMFDYTKLNFLRTKFITESSKDVPDDYILYAQKVINRGEYVIKLSNLLNDIHIAIDIENSLFEYSLIQSIINNIDKNFILATYDDKFKDIYDNLDQNSRFNNKTLFPAVVNRVINPKLLAFLSPNQMHPDSFTEILNKIKIKEDATNNMATTDIYKCGKCGERKSQVRQMQMRCADEPANLFITCLVCYNTYIK